VIEKVTKMNKKAVEEYENLNFEESRKLLKEALDYCSQNGLDKHPVKARTHIHLGIVILAGFKQREVAIKQFRKALGLQPDI
jgi:tetratricopeptide (TPR) repeat protein